MQTQLQPFLYPAIFAIVLYGVRYAVFAGVAFWLADPSRRNPRGRAHLQRPAGWQLAPHLRREIGQSALTLLIFGAVNAALFGFGLIEHSRVYFRLDEYPLWWFGASILVMLLLHDTLFYWLHRAMHLPQVFASTHLAHHRSVHPTAFAAYSFSWREALAEALIATAIIYIVPFHPLAYLAFQTISTAYNVYGHCGRELYPAGVHGHWLGRWMNTATLHAHHHRHGRGNYGLYFTFWDRAMGTLEADAATPSRPAARPAL